MISDQNQLQIIKQTYQQKLAKMFSSSNPKCPTETISKGLQNLTNLLGTQDYWNHTLGLSSLHALVDQDRMELESSQSRVPSTHAGAANDVSSVQKLFFCALLKLPVPLFIDGRELSSLIFQLLQLLKLSVAKTKNYCFLG